MAKGFAIHNAPTDHGGVIPSTQMRSSQMGNLFVCAGDGHFCPKCKCWSTVIKSHDHVLFDGKAVAYAGDLLTCGARIISQQFHVVGENGTGSFEKNLNSNYTRNYVSDKFDEQLIIIFNEESPDIFEYIGCRVKVGNSFYDGKLDCSGKTQRFSTEKEEQLTEIEFNLKENIIYFYKL